MSHLNTPRAPEGAQREGVLGAPRAMPAAVRNAIVAASAAVAASIAGCADYGTPQGPLVDGGQTVNNYYGYGSDGSNGGNNGEVTLNANGTSTPSGTDTGSATADTGSAGTGTTMVDTAGSGSTDVGGSTYDAGSSATPETGSGSGTGGANCADLLAQAKAQGKDKDCVVHTSAGDIKGELYCQPAPQSDGSTKLEVGCKG